MILGIVLAGAAFSFQVEKDRFDDSKTAVASVGEPRGPALRVECGALTGGKMAVRIISSRRLYRPMIAAVARYPQRVRFDERPAMQTEFYYRDDQVFAIEEDAMVFITYLKTSKVVAVELSDSSADDFYISFPLSGAAEAIAQVETACRDSR